VTGVRALWRRWGWRRRTAVVLVTVVAGLVTPLAVAAVGLASAYRGTLDPRAHGIGHDALWLGHAWVDGRRTQSDVDRLAARVRSTGIVDLFVHAGPFRDDGTLDAGLRPRARWAVQALHAALPGVRVQAWLGAHPTPAEFQLNQAASRDAVAASVSEVLDDGFDGVHLDFEPVADGDEDLLGLLHAAHAVTARRGAVLSVSAVRGEPWSGVGAFLTALPGSLGMWSGAYLHRVALEVDQVALMAYDSGMPTQALYGGYVRRSTEVALRAVPPDVDLLIGVPAYGGDNLYHHASVETVPVALRGIRLALGPTTRPIGVAIYVDFTVTEADWASYHSAWADAG
jgi:hypothetical protein